MPQPEPLDFGDYTPAKQFADWPLSFPHQVDEVRNWLRNKLAETGHDPVAGVTATIHWSGEPPSTVRFHLEDFGDGVLRECFDKPLVDWQQNVRKVQMEYGIHEYDVPPGAPSTPKEDL